MPYLTRSLCDISYSISKYQYQYSKYDFKDPSTCKLCPFVTRLSCRIFFSKLDE